MKEFSICCYRAQDGRRLTSRLGDYLRARDVLVAGAANTYVESGHRRHHGLVNSYDQSGHTGIAEESLINAALHVVRSDGHVLRRIARGDIMLGACTLTYGDRQTNLFPLLAPTKMPIQPDHSTRRGDEDPAFRDFRKNK